jgi:hypothetical protein
MVSAAYLKLGLVENLVWQVAHFSRADERAPGAVVLKRGLLVMDVSFLCCARKKRTVAYKK